MCHLVWSYQNVIDYTIYFCWFEYKNHSIIIENKEKNRQMMSLKRATSFPFIE